MKLSKKGKRRFAVYCALVLLVAVFTVPAYATDDPVQVVNNLSDFIFGLIRAIGMILLCRSACRSNPMTRASGPTVL